MSNLDFSHSFSLIVDARVGYGVNVATLSSTEKKYKLYYIIYFVKNLYSYQCQEVKRNFEEKDVFSRISGVVLCSVVY